MDDKFRAQDSQSIFTPHKKVNSYSLINFPVQGILVQIRFSPQSRQGRREVIFLFGGERPPNKRPSVESEHSSLGVPEPLNATSIDCQGHEVCDPIASHDWITKKISLCDLRGFAVNLVLKLAHNSPEDL